MAISEKLNGFLLIDKPYGWTSFDCVKKIRGILERGLKERGFSVKRLKAGHAGTLDPFATGLLIVAIGSSTKLIEKMKEADKDYVFEIAFGISSPSFDLDTDKEKIVFSDRPSSGWRAFDTAENALCKFRGEILQEPPLFSALKVNGKRAYDLVRKGEDFRLKEREVTVYRLDLLESGLKDVVIFGDLFKLPVIKLFATVSKGTYIRSLARDIGKEIGVPACVISLRRTRVSHMSLDGSLPIVKFIQETTFTEVAEKIIDPISVVQAEVPPYGVSPVD